MRVARSFSAPNLSRRFPLHLVHASVATPHRVICGDVGGTKSFLGLYETPCENAGVLPRKIFEKDFDNRTFGHFYDVLRAFCGDLGEQFKDIRAASLAIAGPATEQGVRLTNLGWDIAIGEVKDILRTPHFSLLNDLEGLAWGTLVLSNESLVTLNPGSTMSRGNRLVAAAGTGFGQSLIQWDGNGYRPVAAEGGHTDFGPRSLQERNLWDFMRSEVKAQGRDDGDLDITYERLVSGYGLTQIFRFLTQDGFGNFVPLKPSDPVKEALKSLTQLGRPLNVGERIGDLDPARVIGEAAVRGTCSASKAAVDLFLKIYAAQVRNLAIVTSPWGGIFVGGGMIAKLLPLVQQSEFLRTFLSPGRFPPDYFRKMPLHIVNDPKAAVLGSAYRASLLTLQ